MTTAADNARAMLSLVALNLTGWPYIWGGESEEEGGYDCSGFVSDRLSLVAQAFPDLYDGRRRTARGLFKYFGDRGLLAELAESDLVPGSIIFYQRHKRPIHHVAIHLFHGGDTVGPVAIEAGGAGSRATNVRQALLRSAGVRLTATDSHGKDVMWMGLDVCSLLKEGT